MSDKKNLRQVRKIISDYFGKDVRTRIETEGIKHRSSYICVYYEKYIIEEDVQCDLQNLVGNGWDVNVQCLIPKSVYLSGLMQTIVELREKLNEKLHENPSCQEWYVNRLCDFNMFALQKPIMEVVNYMRAITAPCYEIHAFDKV